MISELTKYKLLFLFDSKVLNTCDFIQLDHENLLGDSSSFNIISYQSYNISDKVKLLCLEKSIAPTMTAPQEKRPRGRREALAVGASTLQ